MAEQEKPNKLNEPSTAYEQRKVTFSTVETQWDVQLQHSLNLSPIERLMVMRQLTDRAFNILSSRTINSLKGSKIIFGSYEYLP